MNEVRNPDEVPQDLAQCEACSVGWHDPLTGLVHRGCTGCEARAIATAPAGWRAERGITDVELDEAALRVFGERGFDAGRALVWRWLDRIRVLKQEHMTC